MAPGVSVDVVATTGQGDSVVATGHVASNVVPARVLYFVDIYNARKHYKMRSSRSIALLC
jgi:hypothetical protein